MSMDLFDGILMLENYKNVCAWGARFENLDF